MLKNRIITASILLPLVILGILFLPPLFFALVSGIVFLLGMWEWTLLAGFKKPLSRFGILVLMPLLTLLILAVLQALGKNLVKEYVPILILGFWIFVLYSLSRAPKNKAFWQSKITSVIAGCFVLVPAWGMLNALHYASPRWVLYVLSLIWVADIAAYFVGGRYGKHKLARDISPGKSWEGVIGALIASLIVIVLGYHLLAPVISPLSWALLGLITVVFSVVGDLFESFYKRLRHVKDSGNWLPGHGGVLDRLDSITAAVPVFTIGFLYFL